MNIKTNSHRSLLLCFSLLLTAVLACNFSNLFPDSAPPPDVDDLESLEIALQAETVDDRPGVIEILGLPDSFDISIVEVEGGQVRKESWRYFQYGTRVDFVDGEAIWTIEIEPMPDGTFFAAWYDPLAFEAGMTTNEISEVIAAASPAGAEPEQLTLSPGGDDLIGGTAMVGDQIIVGLHEGRLVYVETIALMPEGGEQ